MNIVPDFSWPALGLAIVRIAVVVYAIVFLLMFFFQERLIFFPNKLQSDFKFNFGVPFEERYIEVDGKKVHSLLFKVPEPKGLILYFHGNAGSMEGWGEIAAELAERTSWNVWMLDFPGFGKSEGLISSEEQLHAIGSTFFALAEKEAPAGKLLLYGRSIGTGIAVKLASEHEITGLILETPYFSLQRLASEKFPWAPAFLLKYKLRSDLWMPLVKSPILIVHGDQDEIIPFEQGKNLAKLSSNVTFAKIDEGHHNDLGASHQYWEAVETFIETLANPAR